MSKDKLIKEGVEAERILDNEIFKKALKNLTDEYIQHWLEGRNIKNVKLREDQQKEYLVIQKIGEQLRIIAEKGKITKHEINKLKNPR